MNAQMWSGSAASASSSAATSPNGTLLNPGMKGPKPFLLSGSSLVEMAPMVLPQKLPFANSTLALPSGMPLVS